MKPTFIISTRRVSVSLAWLPSGLAGAGAGEKRDFFFFLFLEPLALKLEERLKTTGRGALKIMDF